MHIYYGGGLAPNEYGALCFQPETDEEGEVLDQLLEMFRSIESLKLRMHPLDRAPDTDS